jgi:hypothetical protein
MITGIVASQQVNAAYWNEAESELTYNGAVTYYHNTSCPGDALAVVLPWLTTNYPPGDYAEGYIFRVAVLNSSFSFCTYVYCQRY